MSKRDQSGPSCCANFHGTEEPTKQQFRRCGGCPVAQAELEEDDEEDEDDDS